MQGDAPFPHGASRYKKIKSVVVHMHWDIAFGGFLYIGYWFFECPVHWILHFERQAIHGDEGLRTLEPGY